VRGEPAERAVCPEERAVRSHDRDALVEGVEHRFESPVRVEQLALEPLRLGLQRGLPLLQRAGRPLEPAERALERAGRSAAHEEPPVAAP
jgi:hypothetical protein